MKPSFCTYIKGLKKALITSSAGVEIKNDVMERVEYEEDITTGFRIGL